MQSLNRVALRVWICLINLVWLWPYWYSSNSTLVWDY
jgi:hypothetical protein